METVFLVCAITGGTLVVCLLVAGLFGFGSEHDVDHDTDTDADHDAGDDGHGNALFGMLSVRALTSALLFFGLGGMTARYYGADELAAFGTALGAGAGVLYLVATALRAMKRLRSDGTVRVERAVGTTGTVYLRVPGERAGSGKVHLALQNRTVEYQAVTAGGELPTGRPVKVVAVVSADTVEVEPA
ncbi:hypothetical protein GobsT_05320 [Gemmata obscuriglobus]|uniref:NfeD-like C-terminal domain-containing protein n=1 Tax=Gemmata obscuriglobus TaxID=114 RepID=A0A2Z3H4H0_9BACT|nr:NfeD family protein [Gemmata obscuriglobus]AWM40903.1 hypothetical protein C1280_30540 [Gemmata obscuriglobus]QEG25797.1 hypothetical protein GobsT_05320 [Gemmata obscuriglobus]VTR99670.1 Marine sediment metagenome DNA, contig: S01H1_S17563 OS=marine sediment metagenome GN=S01H1_50198 PE=4 SV=1 [Gemmata obscuriglobus UQM 2246]